MNPEDKWDTALAVSTAGAFILALIVIWCVNHLVYRPPAAADDEKGCLSQSWCWKNDSWKRHEGLSVAIAFLHYVTILLGWMVLIWGGILIGTLFRTLNEVDFWWLFAVWITENLTKYLYMHPEGDFYRKFSLSALHIAAKHKFNADCFPWSCLSGISLLSCFDSIQLGFAIGRCIVAGMAIHVLYMMDGRCCVPAVQGTTKEFVFLYNTTSDATQTTFEQSRTCAALKIFYIVVLIKASCNIFKYIMVVCMADIGGAKYCADGLVSILVHEQHGLTMRCRDVQLALYEGKRTFGANATTLAARSAAAAAADAAAVAAANDFVGEGI